MSSRGLVPWNLASVLVILSLLGSSTIQAEDVSDALISLDQKRTELAAAGKYSEAIPFAERAVELTEQSQGSDHFNTAVRLNRLAELYRLTGVNDKAEPLYQRTLAIIEKALGPDHADTATSLNNLAQLYEDTGAYNKAEPLYQRALTIREKVLGVDHSLTANSMTKLAGIYRIMGVYDKALPLIQRALAIREKILGFSHPDTAESQNNLAMLYEDIGAYDKAEPLFLSALTIREKVLGPSHPDTAKSQSSLGLLYLSIGAYTKAESFLQSALAIREKMLSPNDSDVAESLSNLASLYLALGNHAKSEPFYQRALAIYEKTLGPEHYLTANLINNFADFYRIIGAYDKALPLHLRALSIRERVLGANHPKTAISLNNLATLYQSMGDYVKAEPLYQRALSIYENTLGPDHPNTARSINNLALLYQTIGAYDKVEPLLQRGLANSEKILGPDHPETATSLNNLAEYYMDIGAYAKAEPLLQRGLAINEKRLGPDHPETAKSLNNLAEHYKDKGNYAKAEPLLHRSLAIYERALGSYHPETAINVNNLAVLFWAKGRWAEALENFRRVAHIQESNAQTILTLGDENGKQAYLRSLKDTTSEAVTFSLTAQRANEHSDGLGLELALQRKGRISEILADTYGSTRRSLVPKDQQLFDRWREANTQYATVFFRGPGTMPVESYRALIDSLKRDTEVLEAQLSTRSAEFRSQTETVTLPHVQRAIPNNAALIEWFRYAPYNPRAKDQKPRWGNPRYVAYILKQTGSPVAVDLGEATSIERSLSDFLAALHDPRSLLTGELGRELDGKLLQPLRPYLGDASQLFLSPDGLLNLLPFSALVDEKQHYLAERWSLTYLTSGRDLLRFTHAPAKANDSMIIANPDFGGLDKTTLVSNTGNRRSNAMANGAMQFNALPGTAAEAKALQDILKLTDDQLLTGNAATETALKQLQGPQILHIATHGFFLSDQAKNLDLSTSLIAPRRVTPPPGENPLLRSGLALSGANTLHSDKDDGVLTALEVAGLDLTGTQLAVLSACETGIGSVQNGEGVYGLRRALVLAGVRTQLSSLWKVDDVATKDLMVDYYQRIKAGIGKSQALHLAQQAMRKDPARAHPYYWASFIAIGEDKPIQQ